MQYSINIHQLSAIYFNHLDVDLNDIATLSYIKETISNPKVVTEMQGNIVWYWVSYPWIQKALPLVYKSVKIDTVYRHIKKLESLGYISINQKLSKQTGKTFMRLGDKCQTLLFSDAKSLELSEMDKISEANLQKYFSIGEISEPPIGKISEPNTIIVSNNTESFNNFFPPLKNNIKDISENLDSAGVREAQKEEEVDFFALTQDFVPEGIEPSKKPFVAPEREKTYKYPPFHPTAPASIRNDFEMYVDAGRQSLFEYINYNHIAWRQIKSDKNERPWDPSEIDVEFLNETCKGAIPVKKYIGVKATKLDQSVKKEYHYINLFNYDYLAKPNVGPQLIKPIMETVTDYCESYFRILKELYDKKMERKEQLRRIELNKNLPEGYEGIDN